MKTEEIRNKLHQLIDKAEDKKVKALYTIFEESMEEKEDYTDEFKAELDSRYEEFKKDGKTISLEDVNIRVKNILSEYK